MTYCQVGLKAANQAFLKGNQNDLYLLEPEGNKAERIWVGVCCVKFLTKKAHKMDLFRLELEVLLSFQLDQF